MNNISNLEIVTGKGILFPFNIENGRVNLTSGWELVKTNLKNFLAFEQGTRYFLSEFGVKLRSYIGEPNDNILQTLLEHNFQTEIPQWDPRIVIDDLQIKRDGSDKIIIILSISLTGTTLTETFIFPFYKEIIY